MSAAKSFTSVVMGSQSLMIQCSEILLAGGHQILAVVADDPAIVDWARDHELRLVAPGSDLTGELGDLSFDYLFSITNLAIIPEGVLALPKRASINFHDGPLPRYAGLNTPAWALMNGEAEYGVSYHEMTAKVDEGRLLKQRMFEISPGETSLTLNTKCFEAGIEAFAELVPELAAGTETAQTQDLSQKSFFGKFDRPEAAAVLDWSKPAEELQNLVRALDFGGYENPLAAAKITHHAATAIVTAASAEEQEGSEERAPGTVVALRDDALVVTCGEGQLEISQAKTLAGKELGVRALAELLGVSERGALDLHDTGTRERLTETGGALARAEAFWVRRLSALEPLDLPYVHSDRQRASEATRASRQIDVPQAFRDGRTSAGSSPGAAVVAAVTAYLGRIGGQERYTVAFRDLGLVQQIEGIEAWAADCVPLRVDSPSDSSVGAFFEKSAAELARVRKRGSWLRDALGRYPSLSRFHEGALVKFGIAVGATDAVSDLGSDAELWIAIDPEGTSLSLHYDTALVDESDIDALTRQLSHFLVELAQSPAGRTIGSVSLLEPDERQRILVEWNDTGVAYPTDKCVHDLFEQQVDRTPDATALCFEESALSYRELDERANQLAHHLRARGIGLDSLVGVYVDRSIDMMVSVLGVQKAGGAYVPLDPAYPSDRIALMIEDSGARVVLTQTHLVSSLPSNEAEVVRVDGDLQEIAANPTTRPEAGALPSNLAYVIYTSGSTGRPKGVMVEHRNAVNFFAGMDEGIEHDPPGVWLAVTSLSFDISVLELLYTLTRGFKVVIFAESMKKDGSTSARPMDFGLFMWGADDSQGTNKYRLMIESAKFGDQNGFSSFWTPERHFHAFGGPYPNPAVTSAALASVTENISIRGGSCVLPLHNPIRVAEEWAAVDNLSNGRVGVAFAAGWQPNDFVIRPESFKEAKANMFRDISVVQSLWRGEAVEFANPMGKLVPTVTQPRPVQPELPTWVTTAGNVETFRQAGECGANLLTHLLGQSLEEVAEKIAVYRGARKGAGLDPDTGIVTLMLHTLVGEDDAEVKAQAREPMKAYLGSSVALVKDFAWAFPAFKRPGGADASPADIDLNALTPEEMDEILEFAFERYYETSGLFGSVERCLEVVDRVKAIGVDEIGCLIDYNVPTEMMLESLELLKEVKDRSNVSAGASNGMDVDLSLGAQVQRHSVTHMQCTPSMARMMVMDRDTHPALGQIQHLMIGGEAFPLALAHDLDGLARGKVTNMYGPTETTIWSSTAAISGKPEKIDIGRPIANTQLYILDPDLEPVPVGVVGELMIGGDGVVRGYHERPDLTAERFIADPFSDVPEARLYRTGDQARFNPDGSVEFLGRMDHQVKIRGYRVELGEIEARLSEHPGIRECVAIVREDTPGDQRLVAYAVNADAGAAPPEASVLKEHLSEALPEFMVPSAFCFLDSLPLTPNAKIDRKALPAPEELAPRSSVAYTPPENELERNIVEVWKQVLRLEKVGSKDNFFDLGGHSLLVVQAHRLLRDQVDRPLSLTDLYRFPTIHALAEHLGSADSGATAAGAGQDRADKRKAALARRRRRGRG